MRLKPTVYMVPVSLEPSQLKIDPLVLTFGSKVGWVVALSRFPGGKGGERMSLLIGPKQDLPLDNVWFLVVLNRLAYFDNPWSHWAVIRWFILLKTKTNKQTNNTVQAKRAAEQCLVFGRLNNVSLFLTNPGLSEKRGEERAWNILST